MAVIKLDIMVNDDKLSQPQARTRLEECGKNDIIGLSQGAPLSARHAASRVHRNVADSCLRIIGGKMKIEDIDKVNHLIGELSGMKQLITHAEHADPAEYELFIKLPGDASIRMSNEGAASTHYQGYAVSPEFLAKLRGLAVEELNARRRGIIAELAAFGVEAES